MATSAKSKCSKTLAKDRPFAAAIVKKAAELTPRYRVVVQWDDELEGYAGSCLELPNAIGFGDTEADCIAEVRGNIDTTVSYMLETGETPPLAAEPERTQRVSVLVADYEKATLQTLADAAGQSLPDYLRSSGLRGG